jgi:hypothetical protein
MPLQNKDLECLIEKNHDLQEMVGKITQEKEQVFIVKGLTVLLLSSSSSYLLGILTHTFSSVCCCWIHIKRK